MKRIITHTPINFNGLTISIERFANEFGYKHVHVSSDLLDSKYSRCDLPFNPQPKPLKSLKQLLTSKICLN